MDLESIKQQGEWGLEAKRINRNFDSISTELEKLKFSKSKSKGLYPTLEALQQKFPTPAEGDWAVIGNTVPGPIYRANINGIWEDTGEIGGGDAIDLSIYATHDDVIAITPVLMSETEFQALESPHPNTIYYTYEEE